MDLQSLFAERIGGQAFGTKNEIYKFEKIKRAKDAARAERPDVEMLDFGVGEPDQMAPAPIREALKSAVDDPANRGYADNGVAEFRIAAAKYMNTFFGVSDLDPNTEINHSIGSKSALALLPLCFVNPGDYVIQTVPGYPVLATHAKYLGGEVHNLPLSVGRGFLPDLGAIPAEVAQRAKLFYVNYPNNPTGASASPAFYDELIAYAKQHSILIVQDAAYATLSYGDESSSLLSRPGAKDVAVELHSMSKSYNMTGWRLGFVAGCAKAVQAFSSVKDNTDSGQFKAIQIAACEGIADKQLAEQIKLRYRTRLEKIVGCLKEVGFDASVPGGTFFLYVAAPKGAGNVSFANAEEASQFLIKNCSISTVPWDDVGPYLRFSATFESGGDDDRVITELGNRLRSVDLMF